MTAGHIRNLRPVAPLPYDWSAELSDAVLRRCWRLVMAAAATDERAEVREAARALDAHIIRRPLHLPKVAVSAPQPAPVSGMTVERAGGYRPYGGDAA